MKRNRLILTGGLLIISFCCIVFMNFRYDELARNSSITRDNRDLVVNKLDSDEIRYLVENNIDVNIFYEFLGDNLFKFDNYRYYRKAMDIRKEDTHTVVAFINVTIPLISEDELFEALKYYDYTSLRSIIVDKSPYNVHASLVVNPYELTTYLNLDNTIGLFEPHDLVYLSDYSNIKSEKKVRLRKEAALALDNMCRFLNNTFEDNCGGFSIGEGYQSYQSIKDAYNSAVKTYGASMAYDMYGWPSHNEHQLGLAIDINYSGSDFMEYSSNYAILKSIMSEFGFVLYTGVDRSFAHLKHPDHLRYVGIENARKCYLSNVCIDQ